MSEQHDVLIVGGGTAGITVAAQLLSQEAAPKVTIVDPSKTHDYQPIWTLVGGGVFTHESGIHVDGLIKHRLNYEGVNPDHLGRQHQFVLGKHSGNHAVTLAYANIGLQLPTPITKTDEGGLPKPIDGHHAPGNSKRW